MTETAAAAEQTVNPFEGLDVYSTKEDLTLAEIRQQLAEAGGQDEAPRRLLMYQLDATNKYLHEFYPDYPITTEVRAQNNLREEKDSLLGAGATNRDLDVMFILSDRADQARWRLSRIDPTTLPLKDVKTIEKVWADASDATRKARLATLNAELSQLIAEKEITKVTTSSELPEYEGKETQLYAQIKRLERPTGTLDRFNG